MSTKDQLGQAKQTIKALHNLVLSRCDKDGHVMIRGLCKWCLTDERNINKPKVN